MMYLGLHSATSLAARLSSSIYKCSRLGISLMSSDRGVKSKPELIDVNTQEKLKMQDDGRNLTTSWDVSQVSYVEEFPPLSADIGLTNKHKRRSRVDLATHECVQKVDENIVNNSVSQLDTSTSANQHHDTYLPRSFRSKQSSSFASKSPKLRREHHQRDKAADVEEPFDLFLPKGRDVPALSSRVSEMSKGKLAKKCDQNDDNVEKMNSPEHVGLKAGTILRPGMVLLKRYISLSEQVEIVKKCRELGLGPGGFYRPGYNDGAKLRLYMMCLGLDWDPQTRKYGKVRHHDDSLPPNIPQDFTELVTGVLNSSHDLIKKDSDSTDVEHILPTMSPDVCIVNFYTTNGRLGLHQDRDESRESLTKGLPVVSISIGDSAEFLYGDQRDINMADRVLLESGDVLVFGGESRLIYHGVKGIIPKTAPLTLLENVNLSPGRLNLTFRQY